MPANPLKIKVTGSQANLTSWYMTFKKIVETGVSMKPFPAIMKKGSGQLQLVELGIFYFGKEARCKDLCKRKTDRNNIS